MRAKPKTQLMITIKESLVGAECSIMCVPQQHWEYTIDGSRVSLCRKGVKIVIPEVDFENYWEVVQNES